jgi:50S ribosomal subunit-associated GTPase HflX
LIVANKIDLAPDLQAVEELRAELPGHPVWAISGVTGAGLDGLAERLWDMIEEARRQEAEAKARAGRALSDPFRKFAQQAASAGEQLDAEATEPATLDSEDQPEEELESGTQP